MWRLVAFGAASLGIGLLSRKSLRDARSHGFYRFFAFEAIAALVLLNLRRWFAAPLSPRQLISYPLLAASAILPLHGFYVPRVVGKPKPGLAETENLIQGFENTSELVQTGAYRYIRHPLYASLLFLTWGAFCKAPSVPGTVLALVSSACLTATALIEEKENRRRFGPAYVAYE